MTRPHSISRGSGHAARMRALLSSALFVVLLFAPIASATGPGPTSGLTGSAHDHVADLAWSENPSADGWEVYRSTNSSYTPSNATLIGDADTNSYHDSNLTNGVAYYYKVRAFDVSLHFGSFSSLALTPYPSATAAPAINATAGDGLVTLHAPYPTDACYIAVYNGTSAGFADDAGHFGVLLNNQGLTGTGLAIGEWYNQTQPNGIRVYYHAYAWTCWGAISPRSAEANALPRDMISPGVTTGLVGTQSQSQVTLTWDASIAPDLAYYAMLLDGTQIATSPAASAVIQNVPTGVGHAWSVRAIDTSGNVGNASATVPLIGYAPDDPLHTGADLGSNTEDGSLGALGLMAVMIPAILGLLIIGVIVRGVLQ